MGVPKFFRYISERYPCLSELAREHSIPEFDNLYLDMNGIVHNCSHPDDNNIHFHLEEPQIFQDIYNYIDKLFYLIKPQKLFFLAVDGVAPRAKMNQQRSRRFRSAREAEQLEAKALQRGERRQHERFDSNCITPGTEFMYRLQKGLRFFLRTKISTDPLWQKCRIILSGQETPGEGEHKIMDYIRYMKSKPNYNPNTRHCLYGLDADLIILGLCTHELHFVVLREEVKFGRNVKRTSVEETRFFLLHLGLLREYLELEFNELSTPDHKLDVAQLIDDWVLIGFLVGNDFVPHLPCLHISSNALPLLYKTYISIYPQIGGNINEHGKLNLGRLEQLMQALSEVELKLFEEHSDDLKYMNGKNEAFDVDVADLKTNPQNYDEDLAALIGNSMKLYEGDSEEDLSDEGAALRNEFQNYKRNYYRNKFKNELDGKIIAELSYHYVTALQWVLDYYYRGVQSWDWYYPYHYAPFISDLGNIKDIQVDFTLGRPFLPFQQLLAVLPAASSSLLPPAYHHLMLDASSPLAEFYPTEFETDLNGKKHDWEAVVLIPFIDEDRLLSAMSPCDSKLTEAELARNCHGPMFQYDYTLESQGPLDGVPPLRFLKHTFCTELAIWSKEIVLDLPQTVCVELPNAARHVFFPGFPTMKHLEFTFKLCHDRIKVFEQSSRNQALVLLPKKRTLPDTLTAVAGQYLGQQVYIGWPHLIKAKVVSVATRDQIVDSTGIRPNEPRTFESDCKTLDEHFTGRMGIKFDNYHVLVYIRTYAGSSVEFGSRGNIVMRDSWSTTVTQYPAQGVVADIKVKENRRKHYKKIEQLFPIGSSVFFIGNLYAGSEGVVVDPMVVYNNGRVQVNLSVSPQLDVWPARMLQERRDRDYTNAYKVCRELDINTRCLGRLTGTVWVVLGPRRERMENVSKHNIGLQLKYPRLHEERAGYCRRMNNQWFYSKLAIELMACFCERYPAIVDFFSSSSDRGEFVYEQDIFPNDMGQHHIEDVANWVRQQPHMKVDRITCGSRTVCKETVELLINAVEELQAKPVKNVKLQVKPHLLVKPNVTLPDVYRRPGTVRLFDRVVVVRTIYMVPVGTKGTVIGEHPVTDPNPVRLECLNSVETFCEILFDSCVTNCGDIHGIAQQRVYKVPESALIIITSNDNNEKIQPSNIDQQQEQQSQQEQQQHQQQQQHQHQQAPQQSHQLKSRTDAMRRDWREQQQQEPRFVTAASSKYNSITMNTRIADEFFMPSSAPGIQILKSKSNNASGSGSGSGTGTGTGTGNASTATAAPAVSTGAIRKAPQPQPQPPVLNWRTLSSQAPVKRGAPAPAAAPLDLAPPRSKGGGDGGGNSSSVMAQAPLSSIIDGPSTSAAAAAAAAAAAVAKAAAKAASLSGASTPHDQTQALKLLLGLQPRPSQSSQTQTQLSLQFPLPQPQPQQQPQPQPTQAQQKQTQLLARTLAQSLTLALANIPSTSQSQQQQPQLQPQSQLQPQLQQQLQPQLQPQASLPSQMPKLPQPPLFWQREAQEQQAKLQSELILTQNRARAPPLLDDNDGELAAGLQIHLSTEMTQPDSSQVQLQMLQQQQQQHQQQHQPQQQQHQLLQFPHRSPQQLGQQSAATLRQTPQFPGQGSQYMPHGVGYNNGYQRYNNNNRYNYYPTNNNYNNGSMGSNNNNSNNSNSSNNINRNNQGKYDGGYYNDGLLASNANPRRGYTSIQDFVPIQAYRPKKSQRSAQSYANDEQPMDKQEAGNNGAECGSGVTRSSAAAQNTGDEASSELMRTLKITPASTEAATSSANARKTEEEEKPASKPKVVRKPRVPRIGAKFDLDYIMQ